MLVIFIEWDDWMLRKVAESCGKEWDRGEGVGVGKTYTTVYVQNRDGVIGGGSRY